MGGAASILFADERDTGVGIGRLKDKLSDFPGEKAGASQLDLFADGLLLLKRHVVSGVQSYVMAGVCRRGLPGADYRQWPGRCKLPTKQTEGADDNDQ